MKIQRGQRLATWVAVLALVGAGCSDAVIVGDGGGMGIDAGRDGGGGGIDTGEPGDPCAAWMPMPAGCSAPIRCGSSCLTWCTSAVDPFAARSECEALGGCLARFDDVGIAMCARMLFTGGMTWIGLSQSASATTVDDGWAWRCGSASAPKVDDSLWSTGQPDDGDGTENHVEDCSVYVTDGAGYIADESCGARHSYICMRPTWP